MKKLLFLLIPCLSLLACEEIDMSLLEDVKSKIDTSKLSVLTPVTPITPVTPVLVMPVVVVPTPVIANTDMFSVIYKQDWENSPVGNYTRAQFTKDFNNGLYEWGLGSRTDVYDPKSCVIVENLDASNSSKYFRASFGKGTVGANSGFSLEGELGKKYEEAYLSYNVRFKEGFNFVNGGKLFGFKDGIVDIMPKAPYGDPRGFVGMLMWKPDGTIQSYIYHQAQTAQYGEGGSWSNSKIPVGKWFNITIRIVMNDIGTANGIFEGFIDGKLVFSASHYKFRSVASSGIHIIKLNSFFGGDGAQFSAARDEYIDFDDFMVYTYKDGLNVPRGLQTSSVGRQLDLPSSKAGTAQLVNATATNSTGKTIVSVSAFGIEVEKVNAHMKVYSNDNLIGETYVTPTCTEFQFHASQNVDQITNVRIEYDNDYYNDATGADRNLIVKTVKVGGLNVDMGASTITRSQTVWLDNGDMFFAGNGNIKISL